MAAVPILRVIGGFFLLLAAGDYILCACFYQSSRSFLDGATRTTGRVVEMGERSEDTGTIYYPIFTFVDRDGIEHRAESPMASQPPLYAVGDAVNVLYDPADPAGARLDSFLEIWLLPTLLAVLGLLPLLLGTVLFLVVPRFMRRAARRAT